MHDVYTPDVAMRFMGTWSGVHDQILGTQTERSRSTAARTATKARRSTGRFKSPISMQVMSPARKGLRGSVRERRSKGSAGGITVTPGYKQLLKHHGCVGDRIWRVGPDLVHRRFSRRPRATGEELCDPPRWSDLVSPKFFLWEPSMLPKVELTKLAGDGLAGRRAGWCEICSRAADSSGLRRWHTASASGIRWRTTQRSVLDYGRGGIADTVFVRPSDNFAHDADSTRGRRRLVVFWGAVGL